MQRSVLPSLTSPRHGRRRARLLGAVAVTSALLVALGTGAAQAHDRTGNGGGYGGSGPKSSQKPTESPKPAEQQTTGAYVYVKKDASKPASWENSTQQYLVATWPGASWRDLTLEEVVAALPAGLTLCGSAWGVQEDKAFGDETVFTESKAPHYPKDYIGWRSKSNPKGAIFGAKHWDLSAMVTVPPCGPTPTVTPTATATPIVTPTPTVTPAPVVTATPTPSATVTTPPRQTPSPSGTPIPDAEVDDEPTATPSTTAPPAATPTPTAVVLASTPTPTASFYSQVLADGSTGGASLAATGSSPLPGLLAGGILVLSGAALLLLRRHRTS